MRDRIVRTAGPACVRAAFLCLLFGIEGARAADPPEPWALLPWDTAVGRVVGDESDSEGPKSFAVTPDGGVLVLDQVNRRVIALDPSGQVAGTLPLPSATFDDVEQFEGRAVLVLDRLVAKKLIAMDMTGARLAEVVIEGRGIERSGLVTAMLPKPDGVWLEVEHRHSVKVLGPDLKPCERQVVLGRPFVNGQSLRGALDGLGGAALGVADRAEKEVEPAVTLTASAPVHRIAWLDGDADGCVYAALHEVEFSTDPPFRANREGYALVLLDEHLKEIRRAESPFTLSHYDQRAEFRVGPDCSLWQMALTSEGARFSVFRLGVP